MPAKHIPIGEPAHDAERQGIRYLVDGLDERFTVYSNAWLTERSGVVHEIDAVVVAPHGFYVVELKSWRGEIRALDHDWYIPHAVRSPLKNTRLLAQKLKEELKRRSYASGAPWIESFVFLTHTGDLRNLGANNKNRVHTRKTIIEALGNAKMLRELAMGQPAPVDDHAAKVLDDLLRGVDKRLAPPRRIREYLLKDVLERGERFVEYSSEHALEGTRKLLRVYAIPPLADKAEQDRIEQRCRWEAQVLARVAENRNVLHTDPPFRDEAGLCLPFELFEGVSLSWVERHGKTLSGPAELASRVGTWMRVAEAIRHAHRQGVIHRMLRPDAVLVQDTPDSPDIRRVWLPIRLPPPEDHDVVHRPRILAKRVLIIEDNRDAAESLPDVIQLQGHEAEISLDGPTGIEKAVCFRPHVVLCDLGLPGMDGLAVAKALRAMPEFSSVRLIAVTGYASIDDVQRAREAGFNWSVARVSASVRRAISARRAGWSGSMAAPNENDRQEDPAKRARAIHWQTARSSASSSQSWRVPADLESRRRAATWQWAGLALRHGRPRPSDRRE